MKPIRDWEKDLSELPIGFGGFSPRTMKKVKERIARMERKGRRRTLAVTVPVLASLAALGIVFQDSLLEWLTPHREPEPILTEAAEETVTLKADYYDSYSFHSRFGDPFIIRHPYAGFETANSDAGPGLADTPEAYARWARENQVDLLRIPLAYIDDLAREGLLAPLDPLIRRDGFELGELYEPVIGAIREAGAGGLYGLAPEFEAYALYYNKTMFEQNQVPLPSDGMTWEDVLLAAGRFSGRTPEGQPVYGLSFGEGWHTTLARGALEAGLNQGLRIAIPDSRTPTLDTPAWKSWWEAVTAGAGQEWINTNAESPASGGVGLMQDFYRVDAFLSGRSAMVYSNHWMLQHLQEAVRLSLFKDEWGVVVLSAKAPDGSTDNGVSVPYVFAINAESPHREAAWEWLKFVHGREFALRDRQQGFGTIHSNRSALNREEDPQAVFYRNDADPAAVVLRSELQHEDWYRKLYVHVVSELEQRLPDVLSGTLSVEDMLTGLQQSSEALLADRPGESEAP